MKMCAFLPHFEPLALRLRVFQIKAENVPVSTPGEGESSKMELEEDYDEDEDDDDMEEIS